MVNSSFAVRWWLLIACVASLRCAIAQEAAKKPMPPPQPALKMAAVIELPDVKGRMDHMAFGHARSLSPHDLLFIAAPSSNTVELVDVRLLRAAPHYTGFHQPQGVAFIALQWNGADFFAVANGNSGHLDILNLVFDDQGALEQRIPIGTDADNVRFVRNTRSLIVGFGEGGLALLQLDEKLMDLWHLKARVPLDAHPESFQIDAAGKRCWVNVPAARQIAVIDLADRKVVRTIRLEAAKGNYPMALDEAEKRLIVGCREPGKLLVYDIEMDKLLDALPLSGDVDDVFVDAELGRIYASCGEGFLDVFEKSGPGTWKPKEKIATAPGARTCLFVPEEKKLFLAVPARDGKPAEIRVFETVR